MKCLFTEFMSNKPFSESFSAFNYKLLSKLFACSVNSNLATDILDNVLSDVVDDLCSNVGGYLFSELIQKLFWNHEWELVPFLFGDDDFLLVFRPDFDKLEKLGFSQVLNICLQVSLSKLSFIDYWRKGRGATQPEFGILYFTYFFFTVEVQCCASRQGISRLNHDLEFITWLSFKVLAFLGMIVQQLFVVFDSSHKMIMSNNLLHWTVFMNDWFRLSFDQPALFWLINLFLNLVCLLFFFNFLEFTLLSLFWSLLIELKQSY